MTKRPLIHGLVQHTMVLVAHVATAGGVRSPLVHLANQVFVDLTRELAAQGLSKHVVADMFGLPLRTFHRQVNMNEQSLTDGDRSVWEAVYEYIRGSQPVDGRDVHERFRNDDAQIVTGVLADLTNTGLTSRAGRGHEAVYRLADSTGLDRGDSRAKAAATYMVWQAIYRLGPVGGGPLAESTDIGETECDAIVAALLQNGRIKVEDVEGVPMYTSKTLNVPLEDTTGRDAGFLDHFQAVVAAFCVKLRDPAAEATGGATYMLDVFPGHPMETEARETLSDFRSTLDELCDRIDRFNNDQQDPLPELTPVVVYCGQYVKSSDNDEVDS